MYIYYAKEKEKDNRWNAVSWLEAHPEDIPMARENLEVRRTGYEDDDFRNLIAAVCLRACIDYKQASCGVKIDGKHPEEVMDECHKFFNSDMFQFFVNRIPVKEVEKLIRSTPKDSLRSIWRDFENKQAPKKID